jgi:uncharacterized protein (DUF1778 family)
MTRTALLIRCGAEEADRIRLEAHKERRTISEYVLRIALRTAAIDDRVFSRLKYDYLANRPQRSISPRTAILVRCDVSQGERIREAARRRDLPINAFVLQALKAAWDKPMSPPIGATAPPQPRTDQSSQTN